MGLEEKIKKGGGKEKSDKRERGPPPPQQKTKKPLLVGAKLIHLGERLGGNDMIHLHNTYTPQYCE